MLPITSLLKQTVEVLGRMEYPPPNVDIPKLHKDSIQRQSALYEISAFAKPRHLLFNPLLPCVLWLADIALSAVISASHRM